ncbi:MAG: sensor histidine kinase, partial [Bacteroidota bacterium]
LDALSQEKISAEIARGKQRSRQIVETQEKERLRVARDLHDGIGQKLTALKFSLESLRPDNLERITQLRELSKEIILGVRLATFNLSPPELMDYGLAPALEKMARELSRLTGEQVVFHNETEELRLDTTAEINLYRTVQEAVNNAIKYARANYILVTLSVGAQLLSITIDDDGDGFDREDLREKTDGSGMGLSFMEERISNLNGRIFLRSSPEGGTRISINVPL